MLKHITTLCIALFWLTGLSAQDNYKPDKRLYDCFPADEISQMESSRSALIPYYNYYLENSYYVVDLKSAAKEVTGIDIHTVSSQTVGSQPATKFSASSYSRQTFNPLQYHFNLQKDSYVTYIWKEAGVAIVFYPLSYISNAYMQLSKNSAH